MRENITKFIQAAKRKEKEHLMLKGNINLLKRLLEGDWNEDFLIIPPGSHIAPSYDKDVLTANM